MTARADQHRAWVLTAMAAITDANEDELMYADLKRLLHLYDRATLSRVLMDAVRELEERQIYAVRCGDRVRRIDPNEAARELPRRRARRVARAAVRGIEQIENMLASPVVTARNRDMLTGEVARNSAIAIAASGIRRTAPKISPEIRCDVIGKLKATER